MTPQQARDLATTLIAAADKAERAGLDDVNLLDDMRALDDAARAELDAAIKAASATKDN